MKDEHVEYEIKVVNRDTDKLINQKISKAMNEVMKIIMPHRYMIHQCVYGENDIEHMIMTDDDVTKNWPEAKLCAISQESTTSQIINYYKSLFNKMVKQYITHATSVGDILSYNDVVLNNNIIDISKLFSLEEDDSNLTNPNMLFYEDEVDTLRAHGWKSLIPCFNAITIKTNKKRYFYVKIIELDVQNKYLKIEIADYMGDRHDWVCNASTCIEMTFTNEDKNGLPCSWNIISSLSYEEFLVKNLDAMNWSNKELQLWYDVFGIGTIDEQVLVEIEVPCGDNEYRSQKTILKRQSDVNKLKRLSSGKFNITILAQGENSTSYQRYKTAERLFINYSKMISAINYLLYSTKNSVKKEDMIEDKSYYNRSMIISNLSNNDIITRQIGKMTIKSKIEPTIH